MKRILLFLAAVGLFAASPTLTNRNGQVPIPSGNAAFGGPFEIPYQAVPQTLTDVTTKSAHIISYCFVNSTGSALTLTVQTKDISPLPLPLSGSLAANTSVCFALNGLLSTGGFSVQSSGAGMLYYAQFTN